MKIATRISILFFSCLVSGGVAGCTSDSQEPAVEVCRPPLVLCGNSCVDLQSDRLHCDACDRACGADQKCEDGSCVVSCADGLASCDGDCVDPRSHDRHCGGCGEACQEGEACSAGTCAPACPDGGERCASGCRDLDSDEQNCGSCDRSCGPGESCVAGSCSPCSEGSSFCSNACRDLGSDSAHCGACGHPCGEAEACVGGVCVCAEGYERCGDACLDTRNDDDNCGGCGVSCMGGPRATGFCKAGACEFVCDEGYANCSGDWADGCHVYVRNVLENCGSCGNHCGNKAQTEEALCGGLACYVLSCEPGWGDCDKEGDNGCETDVLSSLEHCGACDQSCEERPNTVGTASCVDGRCDFECADGWKDCDGLPETGCEAHLASDPGTCGACDVACGPNEICVEGGCFDPRWAQWPLPADGASERFVVEGNPQIVVDRATGLEWTRNTPAAMDGFEAVEHCSSALAGVNDWRLPTLMELLTLVDTGRAYPAIDTEAFPRTPQTYFWSSTVPLNDSANHWVVDFETGFTVTAGRNQSLRVRCVRGGRGEPGGRYEVKEHWVIDPRTQLQWARAPGGSALGWDEAKAVCAGLELEGVSGWRLPSRLELFSLIDTEQSGPAIDRQAFPETPAGIFWSSTGYQPNPASAWYVSFHSGGFVHHHAKTVQGSVRCVRSVVP